MLHAIIKNKDKTLLLDFPYQRTTLYEQLASIGVWNPQGDVFVRENKDVSAKLYGDTAADNGLVSLFNEDDTIARVNAVCDAFYSLQPKHQAILGERLEQRKYGTVTELFSAIRDVKTEPYAAPLNVDYYCPLTINTPDDDGYEMQEYGGDISKPTVNAIKALLFDEQNIGDPMIYYFDEDETVKSKLKSAVWDVTEKNGELYGVIRCRFHEPLTAAEEEIFKGWLSGQCSDGLCEGVEQRPITTGDGEEIYVSFWNDSDDWKLMNIDEFEDYLSQNQDGGMQL